MERGEHRTHAPRLTLETTPDRLTARVLDLVSPLAKGHRVRIVSPPGAGATTLLLATAAGLAANHPEVSVVVLLVDERTGPPDPWRVAHPSAEVVAAGPELSSGDRAEACTTGIRRAEERAKTGGDVVLLIDSLNGLVAALDAVIPRVGRLGETSGVWTQVGRYFRPAGAVAGGGSLTVLATTRVRTDSGWDARIDEEFRGCGDGAIELDQRLAGTGIWPAINLHHSSTLKVASLVPAEELEVMTLIRKALADLHPAEGMQMFLRRLAGFRTNADFVRHHR